MGFGSFFKKKKKDVENSVSDVENMIKKEVQPENEIEKMDHSFTAEKKQNLKMRKKDRVRLNNYRLAKIVGLKATALRNPNPWFLKRLS